MGVSILALGDSITAPLNGGPGFRGPAAAALSGLSWVGSVTDSSGLRHEGHAGFTVRQLAGVANGGISDTGVVGKFRPIVLLVLGGTNDIAQGRTPRQIVDDLHGLVRNAKDQVKTLQVHVGTLPPLPGADDKVDAVNALLRKEVPTWQNGTFDVSPEVVDYAAELDPVYEAEGREAVLDGFVHPNRRGNELMARALIRHLGGKVPPGLGDGKGGGTVPPTTKPPIPRPPPSSSSKSGSNGVLVALGVGVGIMAAYRYFGKK